MPGLRVIQLYNPFFNLLTEPIQLAKWIVSCLPVAIYGEIKIMQNMQNTDRGLQSGGQERNKMDLFCIHRLQYGSELAPAISVFPYTVALIHRWLTHQMHRNTVVKKHEIHIVTSISNSKYIICQYVSDCQWHSVTTLQSTHALFPPCGSPQLSLSAPSATPSLPPSVTSVRLADTSALVALPETSALVQATSTLPPRAPGAASASVALAEGRRMAAAAGAGAFGRASWKECRSGDWMRLEQQAPWWTLLSKLIMDPFVECCFSWTSRCNSHQLGGRFYFDPSARSLLVASGHNSLGLQSQRMMSQITRLMQITRSVPGEAGKIFNMSSSCFSYV